MTNNELIVADRHLTPDETRARAWAYYAIVIAPIVIAVVFALLFVTPEPRPDGSFAATMAVSRFFWLAAFPVALVNCIGLLAYGGPERRNTAALEQYDRVGWNDRITLAVVYVSRGDNVGALRQSILAGITELEGLGARFRIFAVTDLEIPSNTRIDDGRVDYVTVPDEYQTRLGSRFKARALEYVLRWHLDSFDHSSTWVLHLDEESQLTSSAVAGIANFIADPENSSTIGQGEIKYNGLSYGRRPFITALDAVRTGDDLGRFRLQFRLFRRPAFGMHGSFFLAPLHAESAIGFDLSERGSVTEDAYFALIASTVYPFGWIDGYIREQSPFTIAAVIKQRRRWFNGLSLLVRDPVVPLKSRIVLWFSMTFWAVGWMSPLVTFTNLFIGGSLPPALILVAAFTQGAFASTYAVGAYRNTLDMEWTWLRRSIQIAVTVILMPISAVVEGAAIVYGLVSPGIDFDVVAKDDPLPNEQRTALRARQAVPAI